MKKTITILAISVATSILASCSSNSESVKQETGIAVEVYQPVSLDSTSVSVSGMLTAKNSAQISSRMMAYVEEVYVKPGDHVKAGQSLIRLNADDLLAKKKQALAQISEARMAAQLADKDYKRFETLHAQQSVSDKELENMRLNKTSMESKLQMARQGLKEVEAMLAYTLIKSPFAGTVTQKNIDKGSTANPGMPLLVVEQNHEMEVTATIPESYISHIALGDRVEIEVKTLNRTLNGKISELSPSASMNGGQYAVKVALEEKNAPSLLSGMYVALRLPLTTAASGSKHLLVDKNSLVYREQLTGVYIVNDDRQAVLRWLRLGKSHGEQIEVLSGLNKNEKVIRSAKGKLYNGRKVSVTQ